MSSNVLSVSALEQESFQLFVESVKTHSSSAQFCRQSVSPNNVRTLSKYIVEYSFLFNSTRTVKI